MLRTEQANKRFYCELCISDPNKRGTKSKCYKSLFLLRYHVTYHHVSSIEKICYREKLAKQRREERD